MDNRLSAHFTLSELTRSDRAREIGIANIPTKEHYANLVTLAAHLERVRALLGQPMDVSSGYRSAELNAATPGASNTSDHAKGLSCDFTSARFGSVQQVCEAIVASDLKFDQIIWEQKHGKEWCHLGFGPRMRREILSYSPKTAYVPGLKKL